MIFLITGILCGANIHNPLPVIIHWMAPVIAAFGMVAIYSGFMATKLCNRDPIESDIYSNYTHECCWDVIKMIQVALFTLVLAAVFN